MKNVILNFIVLNAILMNCANAQFTIPGVSWPEAGIRTDPVVISPPRADIEGDLRNPGRILENARREGENVLAGIEHIRHEAGVQANAPLLAAWLIQSRNNAIQGALPIPPHIRQEFVGFFDEDVLNRARYKVGDAGAVNLGNLAITYGDQSAIVLIDTIVFANARAAQKDLVLWAHELQHVRQYRDWGVHDFAIRYLRSWNGVERDAESVASNFENVYDQKIAHQSSGATNTGPFTPVGTQPPMGTQQTPASICTTPSGFCYMNMAIPRGAPCYCVNQFGQFWGQAQ